MERQVNSTVFRTTRIAISWIPVDQSCNKSAEKGKNRMQWTDGALREAERQFFFL